MFEKALPTVEKTIFFLLLFMVFTIPFSTAAVEIFSTTAIVLFLFILILNRKEYFHKNFLNYTAALYLLLAFFSIFYSAFPAQSARGFFGKALQGVAIYFVAHNFFIKNKDRIIYINVALIIAAMIVAIDGLFQYKFGWDFIRGDKLDVFFEASDTLITRRITASMKYPNDLGIYLAYVISIMTAMFFIVKKILKKTALLFSIIASMSCLLFTYSRSAWLSLFTSFLILAFITKKKLFALIIIALLIFICVMPVTSTILRDIKPGVIFDESMRDRLDYTRDALTLISRNVIFGNGINTYNSLIETLPSARERQAYAHNCYLQMWAEIGILGLIVFLSFLAMLLIKSFRFIKDNTAGPLPKQNLLLAMGTFGGVLMLSISFLFDTHFYNTNLSILFWYSCGILSALESKAQG